MQTEMLHGDAIARMLTSEELDQEFGQAGDVVLSGCRTARSGIADEGGRAWSGELQRLRNITDPADADVRRDVLRALLSDSANAPCSGTVVLSRAVHSRSGHDLAIATAWSVADVKAVNDCIGVES